MLLSPKTNFYYFLLSIACVVSISLLIFPITQIIGVFMTVSCYFCFFLLKKRNKKQEENQTFQLLKKLYKDVLVFDANWNLLFNSSGNANLSKNINDLKLPIPIAILEKSIQKVGINQCDYQEEYKYGEHLYKLKIIPIQNDKKVVLIKNISRLKKAEKKLSTLNLELEEMLYLKKNELQLKKEKFKTIFDKSSDAYFLLDADFNISLFNEKVEHLFGSVTKKSFYEWLLINSPNSQPKGGDSLELFNSMKKSCDHQGELRFEWLFNTKNGEEFTTEISLTLLPLARQTLYFLIIRNMMGQKKIEVELRKNLEREKELNEMRSKFISMASHEFKTPLATILTNMDIMELSLKKASLNFHGLKIDKYIHRMRSESKRLNILMDEVLQLGKIEAGKTPFKPKNVDINSFIDNYIKEYINRISPQQLIILEKDIQMDKVWVDVNLISHVLDNLISNGLKYSENDIIVKIESSPHSLIIEVIDKGIGIPLSDFSQLFDSFFRASNTGHIQGTGLGLVIAKEFVEMHKGVIVCETEEGLGSTFRIAIPF